MGGKENELKEETDHTRGRGGHFAPGKTQYSSVLCYRHNQRLETKAAVFQEEKR